MWIQTIRKKKTKKQKKYSFKKTYLGVIWAIFEARDDKMIGHL